MKRVLIAGYGSMGGKHLASILKLMPDSRIALLRSEASPVPIPGVELCFHTLGEALAFEPHVAILAGPATTHRPQAVALSGCVEKLFIEKPLAETKRECNEICRAVSVTGAKTVVGYNLRFLPHLALFRNLLLTGEYGRLHRLECHVGQHLSGWRAGANPADSISVQRRLGGGVFRELSHEIDYCMWICGRPDSAFGRRSQHLGYGDAEDCADLWLEFPNGSHAVIHLDMIDRLTRRTARAICENATLEVDLLAPSLRVDGQLLQIENSLPISQTYYREMEDFLSDTAESPAAACSDGLAVLEVIELAESSSLKLTT